MRVGAVLAWQRRVRAAGDPSTAAGACRIIHATLQGLVGRLRIDPAARFTLALQDRPARALIGECGRKGPPARHARYGNCLARIWAGLPLTAGPRRGRSDHSHVAGNRALTDPDTVLALLRGEAVPLKGHLQRNGPARNPGTARASPKPAPGPVAPNAMTIARNAGRAFNVRTPGATPAGSWSRSADSIPGRFGDMMAAGDPAGANPAPSRVPAPARGIVRVRARNEAKPLAAPMAGTPTCGAWPAGIAAFAPGLMAGRLSAASLIAAIATALGLTAAGFFHDHVPLWFAFVPLFAAVAARRRAVRAFAMAACMAWPALLIAAGLAGIGFDPAPVFAAAVLADATGGTGLWGPVTALALLGTAAASQSSP